jgi:hypothetical protein
MIDSRNAVNQLQNFAAVDIAAERPASAAGPTRDRIEKGVQRLENLRSNPGCVGVRPRSYTGSDPYV